MDIATIAGIILGLVAIIGSIFLLPGSNFGMFISVPSFFIVFGGLIASVSVAFPLKDVLQLIPAILAVFKGGKDSLGNLVDEAVEVAEVARNFKYDFIVNIQGDEPLINPKLIDKIIKK